MVLAERFFKNVQLNHYGKYIKETFNKIKPQKKGRILISKKEIISLLKNNLKNNDYLMIKGSNATGLNDMIMKQDYTAYL